MLLTTLDWSLLYITSFCAALVQAATGFGFAVIAVPFFLLIFNSAAAIQVIIIINIVISLILLTRIWQQASRRLILPLIAGSFLGFPLGMLFYLYADLALIKIIVAIVTLLMVMLLIGRQPTPGARKNHTPTGATTLGILSGTMASSLAMPGPLVMLYLTFLDVDKQTLRATTLTLFLFSYSGALCAQLLFAGITADVWKTAALLTPLVIAGTFCGHRLAHWLSEAVFRTTVLLILAATAIYILTTTL